MTPVAMPDRCLPANAEELGGVLRDYMEATQRLAATHEKLQREVVRLREELESKDRELERSRRLAELGELAAGVAHEVRNPLGAIQLYNNLLRRTCTEAGPAADLIEKIDAGIRAIDGVVQDTLALAPRNGRLATLDIADLVRNAADLSRKRLAERGVELDLQICDTIEVRGDAEALGRVLVNLIVNAAEASQPDTAVTVESRTDSDEVAIQVLDQGCGISEDILHRIFDPFFTTKPTGTGLGLAIAYRIVSAHGGRLSARNRAEGGCAFTVVLPRSQTASGGREAGSNQNAVNAA